MKKIIFILIGLFSVGSFAQLTMKKSDGTLINDGDVLLYGTLGNSAEISSSDPAYLGLKLYNSSNNDISVKMKLMSIAGGATGTNLEFCINPICVGSLNIGSSYPATGASIIPANGENGAFDHFINFDSGTGNGVVDYVLKFYMINQFNAEIGNAITITYRYDATLGVNGFDVLHNAGINIASTLVKSQVLFDATTQGTVQLYDLNGKLVNELNFSSGTTLINVSHLNSGIYMMNFTTQEGKNAWAKIVKQ